MTCRKAAQFIDDFVDGDLDELLKHDIESHIESCAECRAKIEELKRLKDLLKSLAVAEPVQEYFNRTTDLMLARIGGKSQLARQVH